MNAWRLITRVSQVQKKDKVKAVLQLNEQRVKMKKQANKFWLNRKNSYLTVVFLLSFTTLVAQKDSIMEQKLNTSLYKEAFYTINDGSLSSYEKKIYKKGERYHLYSKFISSEQNLELYAYYRRSSHRTYNYFIVETLPDKTNYYFLKGFFSDAILEDLNRVLKKKSITHRQKIACSLLDFYFQYDEYKWTPIFTRTIEKTERKKTWYKR